MLASQLKNSMVTSAVKDGHVLNDIHEWLYQNLSLVPNCKAHIPKRVKEPATVGTWSPYSIWVPLKD